MADEQVTSVNPKPAKGNKEVMPGLTSPIEAPTSGKVPDHIHEDTLMVKGIDPDTKERVAINLAALKKEHGDKKGLELYTKIAKAGGFLDPAIESRGGSEYYPDLSLEGMNKDARTKVDAILNATKE